MMKLMERTLATVTETGQLILDKNTRDALGVPAGGEIEITCKDDTVELKRKRQPISDEEFKQRLAEIQAAFTRRPGEPSLEDDLYQSRREEEERSRRKYEC
jgi:bifunctional DNA-binding transcriptional regulator/antitoxin component of YhaV-PrlF toxin-antitoxin module